VSLQETKLNETFEFVMWVNLKLTVAWDAPDHTTAVTFLQVHCVDSKTTVSINLGEQASRFSLSRPVVPTNIKRDVYCVL
jgi:hypothetical protein